MKQEKSVKEQILHSGLFKLDDRGKPVGLFRLTPRGKTLSKKRILPGKNCQGDEIRLRKISGELVKDLAIKINDYLRGPRIYNSVESVANEFENELVGLLQNWDFSPKDLQPYYDKLVNKAKKKLKRHLTPLDKKMSRWGTKESLRFAALAGYLRNSFLAYTGEDLGITDLNYYVAHLLIACGIETNDYKTVYNKISKAYYRHDHTPED